MLPEKIILVTLLFSVVGSAFYIRGIFRGETRPNAVSWFIWMLAPFIGVFLQLKAGATWSVLPVFAAGFMPLLVLIFAGFKRNAYWQMGALDIICLIFSLGALAFWIMTSHTEISLIFAIAGDAIAAAPTIIKSWHFPETENPGPYISGLVNNTLGLLIIKNWIFSIYSFGIYFLILNLVLIFLIYRKRLANLLARIV